MLSTRCAFFLILSAVAASASAHQDNEIVGEEPEDRILDLTEVNFRKIITGNRYVFVYFYVPVCDPCAAMDPEFVKIARAIDEKGYPVALAKVDSSTQMRLNEAFGVKEVPTLKFFVKGYPHAMYYGERKAEFLVAWLKQLLESSYETGDEL